MSEELGSGDCHQMTNNLISLHNKRDILTQKLSEIKKKNNDLNQKLELKKSRIAGQTDARKICSEELAPLKELSDTNRQNIETIESNINQIHNCIQQLTQQLDKDKDNHFVFRESIVQQMDSFVKDFTLLSIDSIREQKIGQRFEDQENDEKEEIKSLSDKQKSLKEELNQLKDQLESTQGLDSTEDVLSITTDEVLSKTGLELNDWPIRDLMIALEIFSEENQLLTEETELLQRI